MLISDVQQSDFGIHIYVLFHILFHYRLVPDSDYNSLCYSVCVCLVVSDSLQSHGLQPTRLLCPWNFPGKNTRVGCHFFLQGIFPTQGSNPRVLSLLHWRPFAIQQALVVCFIQCVSVHPKLLLYPFPKSKLPLQEPLVCILCVCFCFVNKFLCVIFQILHISDIIWHLFFSARLTSLCVIISRSIQVAANGIISFFSVAEQ